MGAPGVSSSRSIALDGPLDLRATLGKARGSSVGAGRVVQQAWRSVRTPDGPVTTLIEVNDDRVDAEAWGPGASWALETLPGLLGLDDGRSTFEAHHRIVADLFRRFRGLRIGRTGLVWEPIPPTILGQKVTTTEAKRSWRSLVRTYGEPAPGPTEMRIPPPAATLAGLTYDDFHRHGVERKRAQIIIGAARRADRFEAAATMSVSDAYQRLLAFPGIGIWTASAVLGEALGDPDAIPIGDYHIPNTVAWALAGEPRGTDERMIELLEPYQGHRQRVIRLLHLGHLRAPRYGPKLAPRDIRRY